MTVVYCRYIIQHYQCHLLCVCIGRSTYSEFDVDTQIPHMQPTMRRSLQQWRDVGCWSSKVLVPWKDSKW